MYIFRRGQGWMARTRGDTAQAFGLTPLDAVSELAMILENQLERKETVENDRDE